MTQVDNNFDLCHQSYHPFDRFTLHCQVKKVLHLNDCRLSTIFRPNNFNRYGMHHRKVTLADLTNVNQRLRYTLNKLWYERTFRKRMTFNSSTYYAQRSNPHYVTRCSWSYRLLFRQSWTPSSLCDRLEWSALWNSRPPVILWCHELVVPDRRPLPGPTRDPFYKCQTDGAGWWWYGVPCTSSKGR